MHKESAGERRSSAFQMAASVETCRGRVRVALGPRGNGFGLQERRGGEGRGRRGGRGHAGAETLHPAVPACSPVPPRSPASRPPALQKTRSSPVLKLTADWKIQFPCELLGTWGLLISSESPGRSSQECRQGYGAALLRADDAQLCFPAEPGEMPVAP